MRTVLVMTWANIKSRKLQSVALAMVFIGVSVLFFLSIRLFGTIGEYEELYVESNSSQALIYVYNEETKDSIVEFFDGNPDVLNINTLANFDDVIETNLKYENEMVPVVDAFFTEYSTTEYDQIRIVEGKNAEELLDNEVIFSYGKSELNNISLGDVIVVNTEEGITEMVIAGIGVDLSFNFDTITLNRFWTTKATIDNLDSSGENFFIGITYKNYTKESEERILKELDVALGDSASDSFVISHSLLLQANSFFQVVMGAIFTLIGIILIVVGLFIIRSIIFNSIITESKKIATLRSGGFSINNIISMYLLEYGIIAFFSIIIGIYGSNLLSVVVLSDLNNLANMFGTSNSIDILSTVIVVIMILLIIEVTVYSVAKGISKINPAIAISRGEHITESKAVFSVIRYRRLPMTLIIAIKDIIYNKKMIITLLLFIIATTFTIVTLSSASFSLTEQKENNKLWLGYDVDAKVVSSVPVDFAGHQEILDKLDSSPYVQGTITVYNDFNSQIYNDIEEKYVTSISQIYILDDTDTIDFGVLEGRLPESDSEILLATNLLESLEKSLGDYVTVRSLGVEKELLIVGRSQGMTNQGMTFSLVTDEMKTDFLNSSLIQIDFKDGFTDTQLTQEIETIFGSDMTLLFEEANTSMLSMFDILGVVTTGIIGIFTVISLIVLLNLNMTYVYKERYNYSIYKSVGMDNSNIINIYLFKNGLINIVGVIIGGLIAVLITPIVMNLMTKSLGLNEFPTSINYLSILVSLGIVSSVTLLNALFIKRNISSITPRELLVE